MGFVITSHSPAACGQVTEVIHGVEVLDPYRWLEDQDSTQTRAWIATQSAYTHAYFESVPARQAIRQRVSELLSIPSVAEPWNIGNRYFFMKRHRGKEQPDIVMREGLHGHETVLIDPALRGTGPSTAVAIAAISMDGRLLAYSVRQGGTDHGALEIFDVDHGLVLPDRLGDGFCTGFVFHPDGLGFYYSHRKLHDSRPNYRAVYYHRLGAEQSEDQELFFAGEEPDLFFGILHSPEGRFLAYVVTIAGKEPRTAVYRHRIWAGDRPELLLENIGGSLVPFFVHGELLALTDLGAPNFRIVAINTSQPGPADWRDVVLESDRRIQQFAVAGDQIFVTRVDRFSTRVEAFGLEGQRKECTSFPSHGTVNLQNQANATEKLFFGHTSICEPLTVYCYDTQKEAVSVWDEAKVPFDPSIIAIEEVIYPSKDGTSVPLFLAAKKDLLHSGPLPTFLTGYGGFGSCATPRFTAFATLLIEQGFLFAVPALRGGAELGEQWHRAGSRENRQNSFDDFISAAEWLLSERRSECDRIAIGGGSNAGLLVGAAITQRPDLFRAAVCLGPLLDMVRYHLFDFAAGWADEYGSPDDPQDFHSLFAYSPYHRVRDGMDYPATLFISGDADTRCNPMHARKMAARLQAASRSGGPILFDYKPTWGHMPVQPLSTKIEALTNRLAFICHELGVHVQPRRSS